MIEEYMWIVWLSLFAILLIIEASGPALVTVWFAFGALVSLIISFIPGVAWWVQVIVFAVVSIATLLVLRPIAKKMSLRKNVMQTNVDSFIGKRGYVIEDIEFLRPGAVKIGDVSWTALPQDEKEKILENEIIEVVAVDGNKLIVKKVEGK